MRIWELAEAERVIARDLQAGREAVRIARRRSAERGARAEEALAAGQEAFARALREEADVHAALAAAAEASLQALERRAERLRCPAESRVGSP